MFGYVYKLADGQPVAVICRDELAVEQSIAGMSFASDADSVAFIESLSYIRPHDYWL
jgi:hypothetical protein